MKIGELASAARSTTETIRFYEREGLLPAPGRTEGNYRSYDSSHVERLRFIRNCRALDMTHGEIRALLAWRESPAEGCGAVNQLLEQHIGHVEARIEELQLLKGQLTELRQQCGPDQVADCGILQGLSSMEAAERPERHTHLG
jgi:Cd(II)/Pb(II)-responsive transcriptional regulator